MSYILRCLILILMTCGNLEAGRTKSNTPKLEIQPISVSQKQTLERSQSSDDKSGKEPEEKRSFFTRKKSLAHINREERDEQFKKIERDYKELAQDSRNATTQTQLALQYLDLSLNKRPTREQCLDALEEIIKLQGKGNTLALKALMPSQSMIYFNGINAIQCRKFSEAKLWLCSIGPHKKARLLYAFLLLHTGCADDALQVFLHLKDNSNQLEYPLNIGNIYEDRREYEKAQEAYQQAFVSKNQRLNIPALSKLILISASDDNADNTATLVKEGKSHFESKIPVFSKEPLHIQKGSAIDLAYLAFYLGKTKEALLFCEYAHKVTESDRYEPRSLQDLSEDILIATLFWNLANEDVTSASDYKTNAYKRMSAVQESVTKKPFDSEHVQLILFYLKPYEVKEFIKGSKTPDVILGELSEELSGQRKLISTHVNQTTPQ